MAILTVSPTVYQARLNTCLRCPRIYLWHGRPRCSICKCFMEVKAKLASMHCPAHLW